MNPALIVQGLPSVTRRRHVSFWPGVVAVNPPPAICATDRTRAGLTPDYRQIIPRAPQGSSEWQRPFPASQDAGASECRDTGRPPVRRMARFLDFHHVQAVELRTVLERNRFVQPARHYLPRARDRRLLRLLSSPPVHTDWGAFCVCRPSLTERSMCQNRNTPEAWPRGCCYVATVTFQWVIGCRALTLECLMTLRRMASARDQYS